MKLTFIQRFFCHLTFFALLFSGIIWLILNPFSSENFSFLIFQVWSLRLHGAASFGFLIVFGMILSTHVSFNWQVKKNRRKSGIILTALVTILILSGYGLYYLGDENLRRFLSFLHWIIGIFAGIFFTIHFLTKIKIKRKN
jgi:hypothetical protein